MINIFSKKRKKFENEIDVDPITRKNLEKIIKTRERKTALEFDKGYHLIEEYPRSVSILGSARFHEDNMYYKKAYSLAHRIVTELKYAIVTGGGPGIMEAANKGAFEANGVSLGFTIQLPKEQTNNKYLTDSATFEYFFSRKTLLFFTAEAYIYFPGGFGTFDEFAELITLIQTKKIVEAPVILVGKEFWQPFVDLIRQKMFVENNTIDEDDLNIFQIIDSENEIMEIIKKAPHREVNAE
jgi:uncharacterized protein (TIGR00730 family)